MMVTPMLVLDRRKKEEIFIGDDIRIIVVKISPGVVRIGIDAPRDVKILRKELLDRKRHEE